MQITAEKAEEIIQSKTVRNEVPFPADYCSARSLREMFDFLQEESTRYFLYEDTPELRQVLADCNNFLYDRVSGVVFVNLGGFHADLSSTLYNLYATCVAEGMDCSEEYLSAGYGFYQSSCGNNVITSLDHPLSHQEKYMFIKSNSFRRVINYQQFIEW